MRGEQRPASPELVQITLLRLRRSDISQAEAGRILGMTADRVRELLGVAEKSGSDEGDGES